MRRILVLIALVIASAASSYGQATRYDSIALNARGLPVAGANIAVCTAPATIGNSTTPCSPLATIYTSSTGMTTSPNPLTSDGLGNFGMWALPAQYYVQIYGPTVTTTLYPVTISCAPLSTQCSIAPGNVNPYLVLANCTGAPAVPIFCAINSSMLSAAAPGATTNVLFNNASAIAASADFTWNDTTKRLRVLRSATERASLSATTTGGEVLFDNGTTATLRSVSTSFDALTNSLPVRFLTDNAFPSDPGAWVGGGASRGTFRVGWGATAGTIQLNDSTSASGTFLGPSFIAGTGTPEGNVAARVGSIYSRANGAVSTAFYVKGTGTGNTGWDPACVSSTTGTCTEATFYAGNGLVGTPSYSFTNDTDTGFFFTGTQVTLALNGVSQMSTNGGPGITSSGSICTTTTTRCFNAATATTSLEPYIQTVGGAIMFSVPLVAGNPTTTGWGNAERGGLYFNSTSNIARYWDGTILRDFGPRVMDCGTTATCANTNSTGVRILTGSVALSSGTPSTATVGSISPAFTSTASYRCTAVEGTTATNNLLKIVNTSTSSFTITGPDTISDVIHYLCVGS